MAARQTIIAHLNSEFTKLNEREYNEYTAIALDTSGQFIPYSNTNYIQSATSVKGAALLIDEQLYSVGTTYAPTSYVNERISSVVAGAPSYLDTLGEIATALNNEASFAANFISSLVVEQIFATDAENKLTLDLSSEFGRATTAELALQQDISGEIQRAEGAESTIRFDLSGEIQRATDKEAELYDSYLSTVTDRITSFGSFETNFSTLSYSLQSTFTSSLQGETDRAEAAELQLRKDVSGEVIRATGAESTITFDLSGEIARAISAELLLRTDLSGEIQRAYQAEDGLSQRLSTIEGTYIHKDGSVAMTDNLYMGGNAVVNVTSATDVLDIVNKDDVINSINTLGAPFSDAGEVDVTQGLSGLLATPGSVYTLTGISGTYTVPTVGGELKYVKNGDKIVRRVDGYWDILNNTDILISGTSDKVDVTGDGFVGYTATISPTYVGQTSITTVGTVTTGTYEGSVIATNKGGSGMSTYSQGDLITGLESTLRSQSIGSSDTILFSDGGVIQWKISDTLNHIITDTTNFPGKNNLQEALDFLYTRFQQRHIVQFIEQPITAYINPLAYSPYLTSGKVNFINPSGGETSVYLPPSNTTLDDGTIIRLVHNGDYSEGNWKVYYRNTSTGQDVEVVEIAPHETTAFIWNADSSSWMVGIGI